MRWEAWGGLGGLRGELCVEGLGWGGLGWGVGVGELEVGELGVGGLG